MAHHKGLQRVGLTALCDHIKETRTTVEQLSSAVVQISLALQSLSAEVESLVNEVDTEVKDLTAAIIAGDVTLQTNEE